MAIIKKTNMPNDEVVEQLVLSYTMIGNENWYIYLGK